MLLALGCALTGGCLADSSTEETPAPAGEAALTDAVKNLKSAQSYRFEITATHNWVFEGELTNNAGRTYTIQLFYASKVRIKRHSKIKGAVNPYDPQWELYLEERRSRKMADSLRDRANLLTLWKEQDGTCPVCSQKITYETRWHDHHIVWRSEGGGDNLSNRVLVHPDCHRQIHSQRLDVAKPRLERGV